MKILLALDSFKGSMTAHEAMEAFAMGVREVVPDVTIDSVAVSDGGDGLLGSLSAVLADRGFTERTVTVTGPYGRSVQARYLIKGATAVLEMAQASGLVLADPSQRRTLYASSVGTGEMMLDAIGAGATSLILGLGGSATNDLGLGAMQALGVQFFDEDGQLIQTPIRGIDLTRICRMELESFMQRTSDINVTAVCDVDNPLLGSRGATAVFGPQKGLQTADAELLEAGMAKAARVIESTFGVDIADRAACGAAGGMGAALCAFMDADLLPGIDCVLDLLQFNQALKDVDFVITGEGRLDAQSLAGKAPAGVTRRARAAGIRVLAVAGQNTLSPEQYCAMGIEAVYDLVSIAPNASHAMKEALTYMRQLGYKLALKYFGDNE